MSIFGAHKARITKAANAIRKKIAEFDEAILEPLDFTIEAGRDPQLVLSRKSLLFFHFTSFGRTVDSLRAQREKAEEFARQHPDENGEFPLLQQIQDHWDASGLDDLVEEAETLRDRVDAAIKLLPSSEALYYFRSSTVPPSLVNPTPNPTRDPIYPQQLAPDVRMEIASHSSSHDRDRPADPEAVVPARPAPPPACAPSVAQGFDNPSHHPSAHPTLVNPPPVHQSNPFSSFLVPNVNSSPSSVEQTLKLPTFEIPTFHGDIDNFLEFWDLFSVAVHNNINVPASMKFMYLKSHLRGPAASIIAGFQSTAENYEDAVRTLTNTYGRPEILRNRLWDKLMQLPPASDSPMSQRATYCTVKAIWTQLTHLKEDSSAIGTLKIIRAKFPRRTREKIGEYKTKGDAMWTVDELLSTLDTIIDRLETIEDADPSEHFAYNSQASVRHDSSLPRRYPSVSSTDSAFTRYRTSSYYPRRPSVSRTPSPYSRHNRPPTPYYPRNASRSPSRPRYAIPYEPYCAFCRDPGHPSERCNIVRDVAQRRSILVRYRLCWLCLQRGHGYAQCDAPLCEYCGRIHHRALCWNPPRARTPPPPANGNTRHSLDRFYSPRRVQFYRETQGSVPRAYRGYSRASSSRNAYPKPPSPSRRQPSSPARRASSARRSRSISAVHSATGTPDQPVASVDEQAEPLDHHRIRVGSHSPSSCISVCSQESAQPRLMVVHAVTKNYKTDTDELLTVFLDSGSQFSFICTSLAKHLGLSFRNTRTFTTLTFGGHQFTEESSEVTLILWDQYNYPIYLDLWTRERITTVPRTNTQNDKDIVDLGDRVEVDVLIGIDNYWRIVDLHRNEKLPSGLILSHTRFGPVLSGQKHPLATNTLLATKTPLDDDEVATHQLIKSLFGLDLVATEEEENTEDANTIKHFYDTDLWELGYGWDDSLTDEDIQKWNSIVQDISSFQLSVPRYIGDTFEDTYDLVVCSDASKRVYATAIYILTRPRRGIPRSTLLFAKAKLAPPGAITIPRMELLASHMAAKTVQFLRAQLKPSQPIPPGAESEELRIPETVVNSVSGTQEAYTSFVPFTRTNSYVKLVRITAYILKYVTKLRHRVRTCNQREDQEERFPFNTMNITPTITSDDFMAAELVPIREHYRESQRQMNGTYVKKLHTKRETDGTIRVDMRMVNAQMSDTNPYVLYVRFSPLSINLSVTSRLLWIEDKEGTTQLAALLSSVEPSYCYLPFIKRTFFQLCGLSTFVFGNIMQQSSSSLSRTVSPDAQSLDAAASAPSTSRARSQGPASVDDAIRKLAGIEARRRVAHMSNELECRQILAAIERQQQRLRARIASNDPDAPLLPNPAPDRMAPTLPLLQDSTDALPHTVEELTAAQLRRVYQFLIRSGTPLAPVQQEVQQAALLTPEQQYQAAQVVFHTRQLTDVLDSANNVFMNAQVLLLRKDKMNLRYVALMGHIHIVQHISTGIAVHRDLILEYLLPPLFARSQVFLDALAALGCTEATITEKTMAASAAIAHATRLTRTLEALQMNCVISRRGLSLTEQDQEYRRLAAPADPGPPPLQPRTYTQALRMWQESYDEMLHSSLTHEFLDMIEREGLTVQSDEEQPQESPESEQSSTITVSSVARNISAISSPEIRNLEKEEVLPEDQGQTVSLQPPDAQQEESSQTYPTRQSAPQEEQQHPGPSIPPEHRLEHILDAVLEAGQEPNQPVQQAAQPVRFEGRFRREHRPCVFCEGTRHFSAECNVVKDMIERVRIAQQKGICPKCLAVHYGSCFKEFHCKNCGGARHHRAFCMRNSGIDKSNVHMPAAAFYSWLEELTYNPIPSGEFQPRARTPSPQRGARE
ncbi:unnamed protein product [Cylicocyclus nassatus]|uniref:CCHC-type domain-containing protein n=1 Tax=Cylicocyclus nassatus TaxID=53992 RepID=A0AA36GLG1_CYLNA|nr:unnamed protein product [Cylicocyclus nassatus]